MTGSWIVGILPALLVATTLNLLAADNPHTKSAQCLRDYQVEAMSLTCWQACVKCHPANVPIQALNIYLAGDAAICERCHEEKSSHSRLNMFPSAVPGGGGNHPSNVIYDPLNSPRSYLRDNPQGPRLFYDGAGERPKILCSSCHDPMGDAPMLLHQ